MPYIGNDLATQFQAFATQTITGDGSTGYTLDRAVANGKEILVYINNVKQEEGSGKAYTASGTTITFSEAVASGDSCYLVYMGSAQQTVTAPSGSIVSGQIANASLELPSTLDMNGNELILDSDGDTSITSDTDDRVDMKVGGSDVAHVKPAGLGIGTSSPDGALHVKGISDHGRIVLESGGTTGSTNNMFMQFHNNGGTEIAQIAIEEAATNSGQIMFKTGGTTEQMRLFNDGRLSLGSTTAQKKLYVLTDSRGEYSDGWIARFHNDGNSVANYGMEIFCGSDDASGTNYPLRFCDGDGGEQGFVSFSGGTVSYGAFTANHPCIIPDADNTPTSTDNAYPYGTLLETTSIQYTQKNGADSERGILYNVRKTQSANSKKVLGAYGSSMNQGPNDETNMHQVLVLGDGHILCNNAGGNILVGDGICSSSTAGIGQKATANPSMIIGIAQEDVTFSGSETKLVAVQYGLQQFIPWS